MTNIASIRRAFTSLLSKDAQKKLKLKDTDVQVSDEDIQKARTLVSNFELSIPYWFPLSDEED